MNKYLQGFSRTLQTTDATPTLAKAVRIDDGCRCARVRCEVVAIGSVSGSNVWNLDQVFRIDADEANARSDTAMKEASSGVPSWAAELTLSARSGKRPPMVELWVTGAEPDVVDWEISGTASLYREDA